MGKDAKEGMTINVHKPKIPKFKEGKDDMDTYLQRYEKFAKTQKWKNDELVANLSPLLTGKGLEVYTSMPDDDIDNYEQLKIALLKRYQLTEEGFRRRFRESNVDKGETVYQLVARLSRYFRRWVELSGIQKNYEALVDLIVREQYITTCGKDLAVFLRERIPKDTKEMVKLAEQYIEARNTGSVIATKITQQSTDSHEVEDDRGQKTNVMDATGAAAIRSPPMLTQNANQIDGNHQPIYRRKQCYICNRWNHIARDCYYREPQIHTDVQQRESNSEAKPEGNKSNEENGYQHQGLSMVRKDQIMNEDTSVQVNKNFVCKGLANKKTVSVLRDKGCTMAAIKKNFVQDHQLTGEETPCVLIDGTQRKFPLAKVDVDTPYYTGQVEAMVMDNPIYDLILGNIPTVRKLPDPAWRMEAGAVFTRRKLRDKTK